MAPNQSCSLKNLQMFWQITQGTLKTIDKLPGVFGGEFQLVAARLLNLYCQNVPWIGQVVQISEICIFTPYFLLIPLLVDQMLNYDWMILLEV